MHQFRLHHLIFAVGLVGAGVPAQGQGQGGQPERATARAVGEVPAEANIVQDRAADPSAAVQTRWRSLADGGESDNRGAVQSFRWDRDAAMAGIGFGVSTQQGDLDPLPGPQPYVLDLHEVDPDSQRTEAVRLVRTFSLELAPEHLTGDGERTYLHLTFPEPVDLTSGRTYAAHLRPADGEASALHRVFLLRSAEDDPYADGIGNQTDATAREAGDPFGARRYDLVFFTVPAVDEPA